MAAVMVEMAAVMAMAAAAVVVVMAVMEEEAVTVAVAKAVLVEGTEVEARAETAELVADWEVGWTAGTLGTALQSDRGPRQQSSHPGRVDNRM